MTSLIEFVEQEVRPAADAWDRDERVPANAVAALAARGMFAAVVQRQHGGQPLDAMALGEALEALGEGSMSLLSLVTVHAMCSHAVERFGSPEQKQLWLPQLASGAARGAFALTEPAIGSDAKNVTTRFEDAGAQWRVNGRKRWISGAQVADVFLMVGQTTAGPTALLVPRSTPGIQITPMSGLLGFRAAQIAELTFTDVLVPKANTVGREGMGFSHVAGSALDLGRFCVACGSTGLIRACVRASVDYARSRQQFGAPLRTFQLIQAMLADMATSYKAARGLWRHAAACRAQADPASIGETTTAKYFASTAAAKVAHDAVQIHGANGCGPDYPVQRYFRDARIGEIIEGSSQMQQILIAHEACREFASLRRRSVA